MSIFDMYIQEAYMTEAALFSKMKAVNKELLDKIDGKYPWYFIQLQ